MKRMLVHAVIAIIAVGLLFPRVYGIDDGGILAFEMPLYSVTKYHMLDAQNKGEYLNGWRVEILGIEIYDHLK